MRGVNIVPDTHHYLIDPKILLNNELSYCLRPNKTQLKNLKSSVTNGNNSRSTSIASLFPIYNIIFFRPMWLIK